MYYSIALTKSGHYCHTKTTLVHICMYNYRQEIVYFVCIVLILTGGLVPIKVIIFEVLVIF